VLHIYAAIQLVMTQGVVSAPSQPQCAVSFATRFVDRFSDLPEAIRSDLLRSGQVVEPGEPFNDTDAILDPNLPNRRFIRGGRSGEKWFVWLEHGGFDRHFDVLGYRQLWEKTDSYRWYRAAELQGESCVAINAFLGGVWTPADGQD